MALALVHLQERNAGAATFTRHDGRVGTWLERDEDRSFRRVERNELGGKAVGMGVVAPIAVRPL